MIKGLTIISHGLILMLMVLGSSGQNGAVSYEKRPQEELQCNFDGSDLFIQWRDTSTDPPVTIFVYNGNPPPTRLSTDDKYINFNYTFNESDPSFNLIINNVERNDDGVYSCARTTSGGTVPTVSYSFSVEVPVTPVISQGSTIITNSVELILGSSSDLTCSAIGAKSVNDLQLMFSFETDGNGTTSEANGDDPTLTDYTKTVSYTPDDKTLKSLSCSLLGYGEVTEDENNVTHDVSVRMQYVPECIVTVSPLDDDCRNFQLGCNCDAVPEESNCVFYQDDSVHSQNCFIIASVDYNTTTEYFCQATNEVGLGLKSEPVSLNCSQKCNPYFFGDDCSLSCDCSREGSTGCNHVDGRCFCSPGYIGDRCEQVLSTTDAQTPTVSPSSTCSPTTEETCAGPIAGLIVESAIIAMLLGVVGWFIFNITRDLTKGDEGDQVEAQLGNINSDGGPRLLEVPAKNVKMVGKLPGSGLMVYSKAILITSSGNKDTVVKSPSEEATIKLEIFWSAEIEALQRLPKDVNLVQTLGWSNSVPKRLLFEYINGTNLVTHLTENFSMHEVHQYGNTKRKRFEVPETGKVENLPRYALDVARGLKFLLANGFIHPGIRAGKVLVDLSGKCKLYDFVSVDRAEEMSSLMWKESAPYQWMSPEFLFLDTVAPPGDVWSFGVLMWEIYSYGSQPYPGIDRSEVESSLRKKERLAMPKNCPGAIWQLMNRCWDQSVDTRPKIQEIASNLAAMGNDDKDYDVIPKTGVTTDHV